MKYGGIELGGTKMICAISDEYGSFVDFKVIPTSKVEDTLPFLFDFFKDKDISSLGIGSFGPIELNKESKTYGHITSTPKIEWENTDIVSFFSQLNVPIGLDTDVNAACLGEVKRGAGRELSNVIYGTVGTGIGFGVYANGELLHGLMHPEVGHMLIQKHQDDLNYNGPCPYHVNCLETLASGPSIEKRWGKKACDLYSDEKVWKLEAYYLGQAVSNCVLCYSPQRVILGGGVMHTPGLIKMIRREVLRCLNSYIKKEEILVDIDNYLVLPDLGDNSGIIGAIELGKLELNK